MTPSTLALLLAVLLIAALLQATAAEQAAAARQPDAADKQGSGMMMMGGGAGGGMMMAGGQQQAARQPNDDYADDEQGGGGRGAGMMMGGGMGGGGMGGGMSGGMGGMGGMGPVFQTLLANHQAIVRRVTPTQSGINSVTTSADLKVAALIKQHVAQMQALLASCARGACPAMLPRMHDPLFAAIYRNADKLSLKVKQLDNGVAVSETGAGPAAAKLVQAHAGVVSQFVKKGMAEMMVQHPVPNRKH